MKIRQKSASAPASISLQNSDVIQFVHIPKTGGTSLQSFLSNQFKRSEIFTSYEDALETRKKALQTNFKHIKLITGHSETGLFKTIGAPVKYTLPVTMLRKPDTRLISNFKHILRDNQHAMNAVFLAESVDLATFCTSKRYYDQSYNVQTRYIAGALPGCSNPFLEPRKYSEQAILEIAMQRLEQFSFFGITEQYDSSLQLLCHLFSWARVETVPHLNKAPTASILAALSEKEHQTIDRATALDQLLYAHAIKLFKNRLQSMQLIL